MVTRKVDHVVAGDALVAAALRPLLSLKRFRMTVIVHGLDLTFPNPVYQHALSWALPRADLVVANSRATARAAEAVGVSSERLTLLPLGVRVPNSSMLHREQSRQRLLSQCALEPDSVLFLTMGRLVRRKGVHWFIVNVLPRLPREVIYLVAGAGPDRDEIVEASRLAAVTDRVRMLGLVGFTDPLREDLLQGCDVFVQPNIPVPGNMEGFGLVLAEASVRGLPVVASRLEGIKDAVIHGETGLLCSSQDADEWVRALTPLIQSGSQRSQLGESFRVSALMQNSSERMVELLRLLIGDRCSAEINYHPLHS